MVISKIFKAFCYTLGILFLLYSAVDVIYPSEIEKAVRQIKGFFNNEPQEDVIQLEADSETNLYYLNAEINGVEMQFILDTGCSSILISKVELAYLMRRGVITNKDYIGKIQSTDADGEVSYCEMYNIKELTIGDYTLYDIECGVSNTTTAYLLLGQQVLAHFSKVTIDYSNNTLKLEQ